MVAVGSMHTGTEKHSHWRMLQSPDMSRTCASLNRRSGVKKEAFCASFFLALRKLVGAICFDSFERQLGQRDSETAGRDVARAVPQRKTSPAFLQAKQLPDASPRVCTQQQPKGWANKGFTDPLGTTHHSEPPESARTCALHAHPHLPSREAGCGATVPWYAQPTSPGELKHGGNTQQSW